MFKIKQHYAYDCSVLSLQFITTNNIYYLSPYLEMKYAHRLFFIGMFFLNIGMIVKNITVFFTINAMILESTVTTFFRYECNDEESPFTHKRPSHRVFRKKVKGIEKNIYVGKSNIVLPILQSIAFRSLKLCFK